MKAIIFEDSVIELVVAGDLIRALSQATSLSKDLGLVGLITLETESSSLFLVVGDPSDSVLTFQGGLDPPYFLSLGESPVAEPYVDCFLHFEHHTQFPRHGVIDRGTAEQAAFEFFETKSRPKCVRWQEV
jgi:hypothetical protein